MQLACWRCGFKKKTKSSVLVSLAVWIQSQKKKSLSRENCLLTRKMNDNFKKTVCRSLDLPHAPSFYVCLFTCVGVVCVCFLLVHPPSSSPYAYLSHPKKRKLNNDIYVWIHGNSIETWLLLFLFCLYVCVRECLLHNNMRIYMLNQYSYVRGPLQKCCSIQSGASGLPYYCTPLVCILVVIGLLAVWRYNKPKTKKPPFQFQRAAKEITPSTQSNLFLILICFFLIPKEIPFCKPLLKTGPGRFVEKKVEFPSQVVSETYSTLFSAKFGPLSNPFRGCALVVHDERVEWTCSRIFFVS